MRVPLGCARPRKRSGVAKAQHCHAAGGVVGICLNRVSPSLQLAWVIALGRWKTQEILFLELITPGRSKRLTSGSAAMLHAASISGACAGRTGSYARAAGGPVSRG